MVKGTVIPFPFALTSIYVRSSQTKLEESFNPAIPGQQLTGEFRMAPAEAPRVFLVGQADKPQATIYSFVTRFDFRYTRQTPAGPAELVAQSENGQSICAQIGVEIAVEYSLQGENVPSDESLKVFATQGALNHAWPYWREFCHNAMVKMHLPVSMVPLLNLVPANGNDRDAASVENVPTVKKVRAKKKP